MLEPDRGETPLRDPARRFVEMGRDGQLTAPLPGRGDTATRWAMLAQWARADPAFGRLAEGHADALAILAEAGREPAPGALYGVWAARSGGTGAVLVDRDGPPSIRGTVRFCSGATLLDRALVVARGSAGSQIVDLSLAQPGVTAVEDSWQATGMRASDSLDVRFHDVPAPVGQWVGASGFYTGRPGFWWGGAGVAAAWFGATSGVVDTVYAILRRLDPDAHQRAQLGTIHTELAAADALLTRTAELIDSEPAASHRTAVWTVRAAVERCCRTVLETVPRLVGVAALTREVGFEQRLADLNVYVRQHHGDRDLAELGSATLESRQ